MEGEEEYLAVSTEEGNEQSRSNKKEVDKVVGSAKSLIFLYIVVKLIPLNICYLIPLLELLPTK